MSQEVIVRKEERKMKRIISVIFFTSTIALMGCIPFVSQAQMRTAIKNERRWEFAMDGCRFYDLVRWALNLTLFTQYQSLAGAEVVDGLGVRGNQGRRLHAFEAGDESLRPGVPRLWHRVGLLKRFLASKPPGTVEWEWGKLRSFP